MKIYKTYAKKNLNNDKLIIDLTNSIYCIPENSLLQKIPFLHCFYLLNLKSYSNLILLFLADFVLVKMQSFIFKLHIALTSSAIINSSVSIFFSLFLLIISLELSYFVFAFFHQKSLNAKKFHLIAINAEFSKKAAIKKSLTAIAEDAIQK